MYKRIKRRGVAYYGLHVICDMEGCQNYTAEFSFWKELFRQLIAEIDMKAFGELIIAEFGQGDELGISAVQLIETSSITVHTNHLHRDVYMDVFSCKDFDRERVRDFLTDRMSPTRALVREIIR